MKEVYYLNGESLPSIPIPHDCVIRSVKVSNRCIEFIFEDGISHHDSIRYLKPEAKSLILRYHFAFDLDDYAIYKWVGPKKPFERNGHYRRLDNSFLEKLSEGKKKLEYLCHNVAYCSIITKLCSNESIILDAAIDYVEFEWIC